MVALSRYYTIAKLRISLTLGEIIRTSTSIKIFIMKEIKRKWDLLTKEKRKSCINELITFFKQERNEEIGIIAAEDILDFFLQNAGESIYNKAVVDSRELAKKRFEDLEIDLDLLLNK
jgi:uncharacterized protein (DUF2164 family)